MDSTFLVWALVVFREEVVLILSHPIRLEKIQDLSGRNGVEADLQGISVWPYVTLETSGVKQFFFQTIRLVLNSRTKRGGGWYHLSEMKREKGMHDVGNFGIQFYLIV